MRIIFMGTPEFAVESLKILVENNAEVVAVVTAPDKPVGRGQNVAMSAVKTYALSVGLSILQPEKLKNPEFLAELRSYQADLQIVVAFRMLPEVVWNMPPMGTFNLHGSLLPQYRGAAPINWAIINGETESGVTTFFLQHEIDTGNIIFQEKEPISENDNVGNLYERLMQKGANLVLKTVRAIEAKNYPQTPQDLSKEIQHAPKIFRETCEINFNQTAKQVHDFVRGLSPYPCAWTMLKGKTCKIYKAHWIAEVGRQPMLFQATELGYVTDNKKYLHFQCSDGFLVVEELQLEGKKHMGIEEFLRGNQV